MGGRIEAARHVSIYGQGAIGSILTIIKTIIKVFFSFIKNIPFFIKPCPFVGICQKGHTMITQYEIMHMENLMVRDDYWQDDDEEDP